MLGHPCGDCAGRGPRVVDALYDSLEHLFGAAQAARIRQGVDDGTDTWVDVPAWVVAALAREAELEAANLPPEATPPQED
jgi:hypothetical protein